MFGVDPDIAAEWVGQDDEPEQFEVWPENARTFSIFMSMSTQWRWIPGMEPQRDGLDFTTFQLELATAGVKKKQVTEVFQGVKVMERAALNTWRAAQK
ncbi:DUF1799 domain-containing protein [Duganella sp. BJB476]|uniref:DUF1799 domain-containing protein n=1 Tax=Duganella sp. BJB476 TaxID=1871176 RepID=UPI0027D99F87|nr:DUF1799 domain-containing protein [Duganella sp. BJB476]